MTEETRSPIKDRPLRQPGQSLDEERRSLIIDKIDPWAAIATFMVILAGLEWWRYLKQLSFNPILFSFAALLVVAGFAWRVVSLRPKLRALHQGREGERAVGQFLERLRGDGYQVFHDIVAPGFNIDHVLIGPTGIYALETKTWSKPVGRDARITFEAGRVLKDGFEPDRDPVTQARAQASWLKTQLEESTGRKLEVFPVVLFPGWFVEPIPKSVAGAQSFWMLEPKALPAFLEQEPARIAPEDVKLISYHLSRYIRSGEREL
jgi:hypothetical protein